VRTVNFVMIPSVGEPDYAGSGALGSHRSQEKNMATVWIPPLLRDLADHQESVHVEGTTVRQLLDDLERRWPGIKARICDGDHLRSGLAVVVNADVSRLGLAATVADNDEVHFVQAIAGG
jgi:sulfur-carrier protein